MATFCVNLNIHYSAPQEVWDRIVKCRIGKVLSMAVHSGMRELTNLSKVQLNPAGCNYMLKCHKQNGMNGYSFLKID